MNLSMNTSLFIGTERLSRRGRGGAWSQHCGRGRLDERILLGACGRANTSVGPLGVAAHQREHP